MVKNDATKLKNGKMEDFFMIFSYLICQLLLLLAVAVAVESSWYILNMNVRWDVTLQLLQYQVPTGIQYTHADIP